MYLRRLQPNSIPEINMKHILTAAALAMTTTTTADAQSNLQLALDAARKMEWVLDENRALLLIKRETIRSVVGLVYRYADNEAACEQIARVLSQSGTVGTFVCDAVY